MPSFSKIACTAGLVAGVQHLHPTDVHSDMRVHSTDALRMDIAKPSSAGLVDVFPVDVFPGSGFVPGPNRFFDDLSTASNALQKTLLRHSSSSSSTDAPKMGEGEGPLESG